LGGLEYQQREDGIIVAGRPFPNLLEPFQKSEIPDYFSRVNHGCKIEHEKDYERMLEEQVHRFNRNVYAMEELQLMLHGVFQGRDGAGKSGAIIRVVDALRNFKIMRVIAIDKPTSEELRHPFLDRFFKDNCMPAYGGVRLWDRSWNEDILAVPVGKLRPKYVYREHYAEIRNFEWGLHRAGGIIVKFWMDITYDEQGERFEDRKKYAPKKLTDSDYIAREHWDDYTWYGNQMCYRTGTDFAPWNIIPANDKLYSRVHVLKLMNERIESRIAQVLRERAEHEPEKPAKKTDRKRRSKK